jgi:hypothetical protein
MDVQFFLPHAELRDLALAQPLFPEEAGLTFEAFATDSGFVCGLLDLATELELAPAGA